MDRNSADTKLGACSPSRSGPGMSPEEARTFSQKVDWASTLVIPIPTGEVSSQDVKVDGVSATLLSSTGAQEKLVQGYTLLWVKDGRIYAVIGAGNPEAGLSLANSLE